MKIRLVFLSAVMYFWTLVGALNIMTAFFEIFKDALRSWVCCQLQPPIVFLVNCFGEFHFHTRDKFEAHHQHLIA